MKIDIKVKASTLTMFIYLKNAYIYYINNVRINKFLVIFKIVTLNSYLKLLGQF